MRTKSAINFFLFIIAALVAAGPASAKDRTLICLPNGSENVLLPLVLHAEEQGIFRKHGLDIEIASNKGASLSRASRNQRKPLRMQSRDAKAWTDPDIANRVAEGKCDVGITSSYAMLFAGVDFEKIQPIAANIYGQNYDTPLLASAAAKIERIEDLVGKTVRSGTPPHTLAFYRMLKAHGLKPGAMAFSNTNPVQFQAALEAGRLDAGLTYVPVTALLLAGGKAKVIEKEFYKKYLYPVPVFLVIARKGFPEPKIAQLRAGLEQAREYANRNPSAWLDRLVTWNRGFVPGAGAVSSVTLEKAAAFLPRIELTGLYDRLSPGESTRPIDSLVRFEADLLAANMLKKSTNLAVWQR